MTSGCIGQVYFCIFSCSLAAPEVAVRPNGARDGSAVRSPCESPTAQVRSRLWLQYVFAFRLVVGQAPGLPAGKHGNRSGCPTNSTRLRLLYARKGGACARRLCCKINSANENAPGGPVSSNSGATVRDEYTTNAPA